jgi:hypothetical protein
MPGQTLTEKDHGPVPAAVRAEESELRAAARDHARRVRRFKINLFAWVVGAVVLTALWVLAQWNANGAFERFAHEGDAGDWNPTLWALAVGLWGLVVGIKGLRVHFERPTTATEIDEAIEELGPRLTSKYAVTAEELRRFARKRLEGICRLKFHVAAWTLGMLVITPLNALIEWQDNGSFQRISGNSQPGSWDPWVLEIGGIWALFIAALAIVVYLDPPKSQRSGRHMRRLDSNR